MHWSGWPLAYHETHTPNTRSHLATDHNRYLELNFRLHSKAIDNWMQFEYCTPYLRAEKTKIESFI